MDDKDASTYTDPRPDATALSGGMDVVSSASFWRELMLRGGTMLIVAAVAFIFLKAGPWVWLAPVAVAGAVVLKWALWPGMRG